MNQSTDTDATGPFAVGTGRSEQPTDIRNIQPNWIADGFGIRGPQRPVGGEQFARPFEMPMSVDNPTRPQAVQPSAENCIPGASPDTSIKYIKATEWDGSKWTCVWLPTCASTCDTPP